MQTPRSDVYVVMLAIALVAMITGCVLLGLLLKRYDFKTKVGMVSPAAATALA